MLFAICEAQGRCVARRLTGAFGAAPLVVGVAALAVALLPAACWWAGTRLTPALHAADSSTLALGAGLAAALAGAVVTLLAPARALGTQLEAAPVPRVTAFVGLRLFAPAVALAVLAVPAALFAAPVAGGGTPLVLVRLAGAVGLGAAAAEAALALAGGSVACLPVTATVGVLLLARGQALAAPVALALWVAALAARPRERAVRASVRVVARRRASVVAMRYVRRRDVRRQAAAGMVLAVAGAALLRATGVPNDVAFSFGGATALLGAAVLPLAAPGLDRSADWLWRSAPVSRRSLALLHGTVSLGVGYGVAAIGVAGAFAAAPTRPELALPLAAGATVVLGAALLGGSLIPWRPDSLAEQLGAYGAFGVVLSVLWLALARTAPFVGAEHGARAGALAAVALPVCLVAATLVNAERT